MRYASHRWLVNYERTVKRARARGKNFLKRILVSSPSASLWMVNTNNMDKTFTTRFSGSRARFFLTHLVAVTKLLWNFNFSPIFSFHVRYRLATKGQGDPRPAQYLPNFSTKIKGIPYEPAKIRNMKNTTLLMSEN